MFFSRFHHLEIGYVWIFCLGVTGAATPLSKMTLSIMTQHKDSQHNDIQHNETQHNDIHHNNK
jgi:hypothetical protein